MTSSRAKRQSRTRLDRVNCLDIKNASLTPIPLIIVVLSTPTLNSTFGGGVGVSNHWPISFFWRKQEIPSKSHMLVFPQISSLNVLFHDNRKWKGCYGEMSLAFRGCNASYQPSSFGFESRFWKNLTFMAEVSLKMSLMEHHRWGMVYNIKRTWCKSD